MKKHLFALAFLFMNQLSNAQDIREGSTLVNGVSQPCLIAQYDMNFDIVEGALLKKMADAKMGKPGKAKEGFKVYKGVSIEVVSNATMDYYFKVEDRKPNAALYMLASRGYDNFIRKEGADSMLVENEKTFLTKFQTDLTAFQLNRSIVEQEESMEDIQKQLRKVEKVEEGFTKDKSKLESKISGNEIEVNALRSDMQAQQTSLESVKQETARIEDMEALKKRVNKQEDITKKATKKYENALEYTGELKSDLQKTESKLNDNATLQTKIKADMANAQKKLDDLKAKLGALR